MPRARIALSRFCTKCGEPITTSASRSNAERESAKYCSLECYRARGKADMLERFEQYYMPEPMSGCWLWIGAAHTKGYGTFDYKGKIETAHRVSWRIHRGKISTGMHVLHRCDNKACVNPDHLFIGTNQDNVDDRWNKIRRQKRMEENCRAEI